MHPRHGTTARGLHGLLWERLALAEGFVPRAELVAGVPWAPAVLDEALVEMVVWRRIVFKPGSGYGVADEPRAQRAAARTRRDRLRGRWKGLKEGGHG